MMLTVKERREAAGLTQFELAYRAGVSLRALQNLEQGGGNPRLNTVSKVAAALGVSLKDLLSEAVA